MKRAGAGGQPGGQFRGNGVALQLKRLSNALRQQFDETLRLEGDGLSSAHMGALFALGDHPGATGAMLARVLMVTAQAMNPVLRRLERDRLIERTAQPHNRRADCWNLTAAGRRRLHRARRAGEPVFRGMLAPLTVVERRKFSAMLERCAAALESKRS